MSRVIEEEIQLNQKTPGVVLADGVANVDSEIMVYRVPEKSQLELRPNDFIGLYLADATPTELPATSLVTVLKTDPQGRRTKVLAQGEYAQFKELVDLFKKWTFKAETITEAGFRLVIKVLATVAADDVQTRFTISCKNVYETLD